MKRLRHKSLEGFYQDYAALDEVAAPELRRARAIGLLKRIRRAWARERGKSETANYLLLLAILVRAYLDFLSLIRRTVDQDWIQDHSTVEEVWDRFCDLKDRIDYLSRHLEESVLRKMKKKCHDVEGFFKFNFGQGMYTSPDLVCRRVLCSICGRNIRTCEHMPGRLYNGIRCTENPQNCELRSVSLVEHPADLRCRIWPWKLEKDGDGHKMNSVRIMTIFQVDDFLQSNDWEKSV